MDFKEIFNNKPRCQHFLEDGSRCTANPQTNKKFCFMHDPNQKQKQAEARKKGGQARFQLYERKVPRNFKYNAPTDRDQVEAFIDEIASYYAEDLMDLRSARFFLYVINTKLAKWNARDRNQYRAVRSAEQQARILARERDPWSPVHGALRQVAKAKEEAAKATGDDQTLYPLHPTIAAAVGPYPSTMNEEDPVPGTKLLPTNPRYQEQRHQEREQLSKTSAMPSDVALSFRELDELKKEEERKEQERAAARKKLSQASQQETQESEPPKHPPQPAQFEQQQQRMMQNDMNQLTECVAEQVRMTAAAKAKKYGWKKRGGTKY